MFNGNVRFIISRNLGDLGPIEGPPIEMQWNAVWGWIPLLPWLLVAALVMLRPNRGRAAWILVLPALTLFLSLPPITTDFRSTGEALATVLPILPISAIYLSFTTLLLLSGRLVGKRGWRQTLCALIIPLAAGAVFEFFSLGLSFSAGAMAEIQNSASILGLMIGATAGASVIAGYKCRVNFTRRRYNAWFLRGLFILVFLEIGMSFLVSLLMGLVPSSMWLLFLFIWAIYTVVMPLMLYILMFPFLMFMFWNKEYRRRLRAIFGCLPASAFPASHPEQDAAGEDSPQST